MLLDNHQQQVLIRMLKVAGCLQLLFCYQTGYAFRCKTGRKAIKNGLVCSGRAQCPDCSDEEDCPEKHIMFSCGERRKTGKNFCFREEEKCDGIVQCGNCADEINCTVQNHIFHCNDKSGCSFFSTESCSRNSLTSKIIVGDKLLVSSCRLFCDGIRSCHDYSDERKIGFGFKCTGIHNIKPSRRCILPQEYLFKPKGGPYICLNNADNCFMHNEDYRSLNTRKCWPCLDGTIIQRSQVCDKIFDCPDLSDECLCSKGNKISICHNLNQANVCAANQVLCAEKEECINITKICDGKKNCMSGTDEKYCIKARSSSTREASNFTCRLISNGGEVKKNAVECDGVFDCELGEDECNHNCTRFGFYCNKLRTFIQNPSSLRKKWLSRTCRNGLSPKNLCDKIPDCRNGIDEIYCMNSMCDENNLTEGFYDNEERCDLKTNCKNMADELNCSSDTHFYCDSNTRFISRTRVFDGFPDCVDFSDECIEIPGSISSPKELIGNKVLYAALWIIMLLAIVGNLIVLVNTSLSIVGSFKTEDLTRPSPRFTFEILVFNLSVSDFLMGFYLLFITAKSLQFSGHFCKEKMNWLLSNQCNFAGVLAMVSSQTSVLTMVLMTSYRLYGVINPFKAGRTRSWNLILFITFIWLVSILLAVVPIMPWFIEKFAWALIVDEPYYYSYLTFVDLLLLTKTANSLPGMKRNISQPSGLTVQSFCEIFNQSKALPSYCIEATREKNSMGYYNTDAVCLPRYYGKPDETASSFTLLVILINFVAFIYMFVAYFVAYHFATASKMPGQTNRRAVEARNKVNQKIWRKISLLILSDFLCWIPICIMSFISYSGIEIPPTAYPITAIVLIPINSAINPWIYSNFLVEYFKKILRGNRDNQPTQRHQSYGHRSNTKEMTSVQTET